MRNSNLKNELTRPLSFAEEILHDQVALWPSLDGTRLVYASFNDTLVSVSQYPWFSFGASSSPMGVPSGSAFPETHSIRYPTPGTLLPAVLLHVLDISNMTDIKRNVIQPPIGLDGQ